MHQEVAHGELAGDVRVVHREPREVADHRRLPFDLPLLHQQGERRGRDDLGVRRDAEPGPRVHRIGLAHLADAEPLRQDHPSVLHDGHGDAGHGELAHHAGDVGVEPGRRSGGPLCPDRGGDRGQCDREEQGGGEAAGRQR